MGYCLNLIRIRSKDWVYDKQAAQDFGGEVTYLELCLTFSGEKKFSQPFHYFLPAFQSGGKQKGRPKSVTWRNNCEPTAELRYQIP